MILGWGERTRQERAGCVEDREAAIEFSTGGIMGQVLQDRRIVSSDDVENVMYINSTKDW